MPLQEYKAGRLLTGEMKKLCIETLQEFVKGFQEVSLDRYGLCFIAHPGFAASCQNQR